MQNVERIRGFSGRDLTPPAPLPRGGRGEIGKKTRNPVPPSTAGKGVRGLGFGLLLCWAVLGCSDPSPSKDLVLLADPPSLVRGESVSVMVTAPEALFDRDLDEEVVSSGGLVLRGFYRSSATSGLALLVTTETTEVGRHELVLEMGGGRGTLAVSVLGEPVGHGEVFASNAEAGAGADWATLYIEGSGTSFDSRMSVSVEGAEGMSVLAWRAVSGTRLEVYYSIALEQKPTIAQISIRDGLALWHVPFSIVAAGRFENQAGPQVVVKGRASTVTLRHPSAGLARWTRLFSEAEGIALGEAEEWTDGSVGIPVRVPFEFEGESLSLLAKTYSADRRFVEVMPVELLLHEPGAAFFLPSRVALDRESQQGELVTVGIDLLGFTRLDMAGDTGLAVERTFVQSGTTGTVDFLVSPSATPGYVRGALTVSGLSWPVAVALTSDDYWTAASAVPVMGAGDRMLVPILTTGLDLTSEEYTLEAGEKLTVHSYETLEPGCLLADVSAHETAWPGEHSLWLRHSHKDLHVSIDVEEGLFGH